MPREGASEAGSVQKPKREDQKDANETRRAEDQDRAMHVEEKGRQREVLGNGFKAAEERAGKCLLQDEKTGLRTGRRSGGASQQMQRSGSRL
eukprot:929966-Pleurochrysis_carterae.AAC.2